MGLTHSARRTPNAMIMVLLCVASLTTVFYSSAASPGKPVRSRVEPIVYDIDAARDICDSLPLDRTEGIWLFPDDNVIVFVRRLNPVSPTSLPEYEIAAIASSDIRIHPGDVIGYLHASPKDGEYKASLFTRRKSSLLTGSQECTATLNKEADRFILTGHSKRPSFRVTFNPAQLMPKLWRMIRFNAGISVSPHEKEEMKAGMIKIHPSYDHNGSSRRRTRYL